MKIKMQGRVSNIKRGDEFTDLTITFKGKVLNTRYIAGKDTAMQAELKIKSVISDEIKFGSVFTIVMDDEGVEERLD